MAERLGNARNNCTTAPNNRKPIQINGVDSVVPERPEKKTPSERREMF
jgi:hypothetical protein